MMQTVRYWLIRKLARGDGVLLNAELDDRGCVLATPALISGNVFRPGLKVLVRTEDGQLLALGEAE